MRNVREAWRNIAQDPEALSALRKRASSMPAPATAAERYIEGDHGSLRWTA
jgi:hypothetical protein